MTSTSTTKTRKRHKHKSNTQLKKQRTQTRQHQTPPILVAVTAAVTAAPQAVASNHHDECLEVHGGDCMHVFDTPVATEIGKGGRVVRRPEPVKVDAPPAPVQVPEQEPVPVG